MILVLVALLAAPVPKPATDAGAYNLGRLPARVVRDFGRLATPSPLLILGMGGALAAAAHPADFKAGRTFSRSNAVDEALDAGDTGGTGLVQVGAAVAVYAVGGLTHHARAARLGTALVEAQIVNGVLTQGLKLAVDRTRPDGGSYSFPSGHTSATFVTADVLQQQFGWRVGIPAYAGGLYVAASRMAERRHYLSDVVFGAALGLASSRSIGFHVRKSSVTAAPAFVKGGVELVFTVH